MLHNPDTGIRRSDRPYRLLGGRPYATENVRRPLAEHRRMNGFKSWAYSTQKKACAIGRRIHPSQPGNCVQLWLQDHVGNRPAELYNEDQLV